MLTIKQVTKKFGDFCAVDNLNIKIEPKTIFGLVGANGAGKTTTFRMILGLIKPTNGTITWNGDIIDIKKSHLIGYLPEERGLYRKLKIKDQLIYLAKLRGMTKKDAIEKIHYWMKRFRIEHYLNKRAGDLSKGNQQKIQFIAAILHSPQLIILDEPFSGLDPVNVEELKKAVIDLKNEGATILFSSHRMEHVEELCEGICMIKNGNIVAKGSIEEIKSSYQKNKLMVQTEIDLHFAQKLEGVLSIEKVKNYHLITLDDEKKSHEVIKEIINHGMIKKFEIKEPTLNEIFIDKVGDKNE